MATHGTRVGNDILPSGTSVSPQAKNALLVKRGMVL